MENLIFCLNATVPVFLTLMLGYLFRRVGLFDDAFTARLNTFVFRAALPALLFADLAAEDFRSAWDGRFVAFCFAVTLASIAISFLLSLALRSREIQGEFIQASYRSSAAILGIAIIQNLYGNAGMAPLMIVGSVPLYNIMAVVVLSCFRPEGGGLSRERVRDTLRGIVTNPILLGIAAGLLWSVLELPLPDLLRSTVDNLGRTATPLGLMAMGGALRFEQAFARPGPTLVCVGMKLVGYAALFLPLAAALGFAEEKLVAVLIMLGSATTVSCYIMARNMGHEGAFTSGVVMLTTLFSALTLTGWLFLCRVLGLI